MYFLRQSTAVTLKLGPFVDDTDGKTAETGLAIAQADIRLSKNGGAFAQSNNAAGATHDEAGEYGVPLDTTDTNTLGTLKVKIHVAGALPVWETCMVMPANVWDSLFGADKLQVHADEITNGLITAAAIATDAIDADALAANAVTEIQAGLSTLDAAGVRAAVGLAAANLDTQIAALPTAQEIENEVLDAAMAGHVGAGTVGAAINAAGSAGDPLATVVPGAYGAGTVGKRIGDYLDAAVSSRAVAGDEMDLVNAPNATAITAIQSGLAVPGDEMDLVAAPNAAAVQAIADETLSRGISNVEATAPHRSLSGAIAKAVNKVEDNGLGGITVYQTDDTTPLFTQGITTDPALEPIESVGGAT